MPKKHKSESEIINPPTFQLPDDFSSSKYELWSVRLPAQFDPAHLDGVKLHVNPDVMIGSGNTGTAAAVSILSSFKVNGKPHGFALGHGSESESFRLLAPKHPQNDSHDNEEKDVDTDDDDDEKKMLKTVPHPFDRHINLLDITGHELAETDLAPSMEKAPDPMKEHGVKVRHAYSHIPQAVGLKRRWKQPGSSGVILSSSRIGVVPGGGGKETNVVVHKKRKMNHEPTTTTTKKQIKEEEDEEEEEEAPKTPSNDSKKHKKESKKSHKKSTKKSHKKDKKKEKRKSL